MGRLAKKHFWLLLHFSSVHRTEFAGIKLHEGKCLFNVIMNGCFMACYGFSIQLRSSFDVKKKTRQLCAINDKSHLAKSDIDKMRGGVQL